MGRKHRVGTEDFASQRVWNLRYRCQYQEVIEVFGLITACQDVFRCIKAHLLPMETIRQVWDSQVMLTPQEILNASKTALLLT